MPTRYYLCKKGNEYAAIKFSGDEVATTFMLEAAKATYEHVWPVEDKREWLKMKRHIANQDLDRLSKYTED